MGIIDLEIDQIIHSRHWRSRHERMKRLKSLSVPNSDPHPKLMDSMPSQEVGGSDTHTTACSMDLELYKAAKKGAVDDFLTALERVSAEKNLPLKIIFNQLSPLQNTYLHIAANFGNEEVSGIILQHFRYLLYRTNLKGDTALHLAARGGHPLVVEILVEFAENDRHTGFFRYYDDLEHGCGTSEGKIIERMVNEAGNTPLHEALINNHEIVVDYLLVIDKRAAYVVNNEGKSPLYLAVEAGCFNNVKTILNWEKFEDQDILDEQLMKEKSLIHAAISGRNKALLQEIAEKKPMLVYVKDEYQRSALHFAASIGFLDGVRYLLEKFSMDTSEKDQDGSCPVHIASKNGHVAVIQELLQHGPDATEFLNQRGQNILHVAAKNGKDNVVMYILKTPGLEVLLNERDRDGNTPLHLASMNWHPKVVSSLTWNRRVNLEAVNNEGLTALEVTEAYMETMPPYRKQLTHMALRSAGAQKMRLQNTLKVKSQKFAKYEPHNMGYWKDRVNTLLLVATLVATVTFAAGFTMPGGYNSSEPDQGMATLLRKWKFQVFVICDTISMYGSIVVAVSLIWAQLGDLNLVLNALRLAIPLLGISLTMMSVAFLVGVCVVVGELTWLANVVLILGIISLACLLALFLPLYLPYTSSSPILRYISYCPFYLLLLASGSFDNGTQEE